MPIKFEKLFNGIVVEWPQNLGEKQLEANAALTYCVKCGAKLGVQDPGGECGTCKWIQRISSRR